MWRHWLTVCYRSWSIIHSYLLLLPLGLLLIKLGEIKCIRCKSFATILQRRLLCVTDKGCSAARCQFFSFWICYVCSRQFMQSRVSVTVNNMNVGLLSDLTSNANHPFLTLHWLDVAHRIRFRLCIQLSIMCRHSMAPGYIWSSSVNRSPTSTVTSICDLLDVAS